MTVDDVLSLERLGGVATSPDGEWIAVVITRAATPRETYRDFRFAEDRADIWLLRRTGGEATNLTKGIEDGSGHYNPVWSPDGRRLAFLSTRGGNGIFPYIWERASGRLGRLTGRRVDSEAFNGDQPWPTQALIWADSTTVLCAVEASESAITGHTGSKIGSLRTAVRQWRKAEKGVDPTVSVLESGREIPESERPRGALLAVDVRSGRTRVVLRGNVRQLLMSSTRRHVAVILESGRVPPEPGRPIPSSSDRWYELVRSRLAIVSLSNLERPLRADAVPDPKLWVGVSPHTWSPDGTRLAVIAKRRSNEGMAITLWMVLAATGVAHEVVGASGLDVAATAWSSEGNLLALARSRIPPVAEGREARLDWWSIEAGTTRPPANLTSGLETAPATLIPTRRQRLMGIASGDIWMIDAMKSAPRNLTADFEPAIRDIVWPAAEQQRLHAAEEILVETERDGLYRVEVRHTDIRPSSFHRPTARATIAEYHANGHFVVFTASERDGTFLWTGDGVQGQFNRRIALNSRLSGIADARRMLIEYQGVEGDSLKALLLLPVGYESGRRYPMITDVYLGRMVTDTMPYYPVYEKNFASSTNVHLLPARGYAVLFPSMPPPPIGGPGDPYMEMPKGVIPALDKVIALGIADPERLGVMGHSYGGYSTYAMVTYTNRFKAALVSAGVANNVSFYGVFGSQLRYTRFPHEDIWAQGYMEAGPMADTPWGNLWRYLRNSPYYLVERVETPVMIIHGDVDYVPIQQGEEFFTALYRLGKKAQFVRYSGEGHVVSSPANVRDMWGRIFGWFDERLKGDKPHEDSLRASNVSPKLAR